MGGTPWPAHPATDFFKKKKPALGKHVCSKKWGRELCGQGANELLPAVGRLARPLQSLRSGGGGRGRGRRCRVGLTPVRRHHSGKGNGGSLPIPSAVSQPPLVPGDGHAHTASWDTSWGGFMHGGTGSAASWLATKETTPAVRYDARAWLPSWPLEVTTPVVHDVCARFPRWLVKTATWAATCVFSRPALKAMPLEIQTSHLLSPEGWSKLLLSQDPQNTYHGWHRTPLAGPPGCDPPVPPLGPTHSTGPKAQPP
jgi:hypothetical protein